MWKILNVIAILIVGGAGYVAYLNRDALRKEKDLLSRAEKYREQTKDWYRRAGERMKALEGQRDGLIAEREAAEAQLKKKEEELATAKSDLEMMKARIAEKQADLDDKKEVVKEYGDFEETFAKVEAMEDSIAGLTAGIAGMIQTKAANVATLASTGSRIQDYQNLELWQKSGKMKSLNASVTMVSPEFRFAIINAGGSSGVVSRALLDVVRGGTKIADLRVAVLEPNRSVCNIESVVPGESVQPGDRVVVNEASKPTAKDVAPGGEGATPASSAAPATAPVAGTPPAGEAGTDGAPAPGADADDDPFGGLSTEGVDPAEGAEDPAEAPDAGEMPEAEDGAETVDPFAPN